MGRNKETMKRVLKFISPYKAKIIIMLLTALVTVYQLDILVSFLSYTL